MEDVTIWRRGVTTLLEQCRERMSPDTYDGLAGKVALQRAIDRVSDEASIAGDILVALHDIGQYLTHDERRRLNALIKGPVDPRSEIREANVRVRAPRATRKGSSPDVLVIAATQLEYDVAAELAGVTRDLEQRRRNVGEYIAIDLGLTHCSTWLLRCKAGAIGPNGAAIRASAAITELSPRPFAVISVGIAYGLQRRSQQIGDLLVAEQLCLYEVERRGATRRISRGDRPSASGVLLDWFHSARADWPLAGGIANSRAPRFHSGLLMTGEKLVDDPEFVSDLLAIEPEAVGGEMEGAGIYSAAVPKQTNWGVVKGICDWGYDKDSRYQEIAARNAFDFVYHALDQPVVKRALRASRDRGGQRGSTRTKLRR